MIKTFTFLKKKAGLSREEFLRHWKEIHGPLAAKVVPGFKRYAQYHPVPGFDTDIDGIGKRDGSYGIKKGNWRS